MRERLIEILNDWLNDFEHFGVDGFADYLLKNNVMVLPYKVGDTLYRIYDNHFIVDDYKIDTIMIAKDHVTVFDDSGTMYDSELVGDVVFLSRGEAEKALERRKAE